MRKPPPARHFVIYDPMHVVVSFLVSPGYTAAGTTRLYAVFTNYSYQDDFTNYRYLLSPCSLVDIYK